MEEQQSASCPVSASSPPVHSSSSSSPPPPTSPLSHSVNGPLDPLAAAVIVSCGTLAIPSSSGVITPPHPTASAGVAVAAVSSSCKSSHIAKSLLTSDSDIEQATPNYSEHLIMPSIATASPTPMVPTSSPASPPATPVTSSVKSTSLAHSIPSSNHSTGPAVSFAGQVITNPAVNSSNQPPTQQQQQSWYSHRTPVHLFHTSAGPPSPPSSTIGLMSGSGTVDHHQWGALTAAVVAASSSYVTSPHSSPTLYPHHSHPSMVHHGSATGPNTVSPQYTDMNAYYNGYYGPGGDNFAAVAELMASPPQSNESMPHPFAPSGAINSNINHSSHHAVHPHHHPLAGFSPRSTSSILMSSSASPIVDPLSPASEVSPSSTGTTSSICQSDQIDMKPGPMSLLDHNVGSNSHNQNENIGSHLNSHFHHHHPHLHFRMQGDNCDLPPTHNSGVMVKAESDPSSPSLVSSTSSMVSGFMTSNGTIHSSNGLHLLHSSTDASVNSGTGNNTGNSRPQPVRSPFEWMTTSKKTSGNSNSNNNGNNSSSNNSSNNNSSHSSNSQVVGNNGSGNNGTGNGGGNNSSYGPSQAPPGKTRTRDKYRVVYSDHQRVELEKEFYLSRYITIRRKSELASMLALSERQVKIWFQNRRAKERKQNKKKEEAKSKDSTGQHHHSTSGSTGGQVPGAQTPHHMINGTMATSNVQTGGLSGMVSPAYGAVLSTVPSTVSLMGESGLKMVGTASPSTASSPSSPTYTHVVHHHHQLNHHHSNLHNPHHTGHLLNYAETAHCNHY